MGFFPPTIFERPAIKNIATNHDNQRDNQGKIERPIIQCMYSHSSDTSYDHTEPQRANNKEAPKSKEASKEMHRQRKECTPDKLRPAKFGSKIDNIFEKTKTNRDKWTHHSRV